MWGDNNIVKEWRRKSAGRMERKSNKKTRQQKMVGREGGGLDGWGISR